MLYPYKFVFQRVLIFIWRSNKKELIGVSCGDPSSLLLFLLFPHNNIMANERSGATRKVAVAGRLQDGNLYGVVELAATEPLAVGKTA